MVRVLLCLSVSLAWSFATLAGARVPKRHVRLALVVGNNVGLRSEAPLRYAENEAGKVARTLMQIGHVPIHHVTLLQGKSSALFWTRLKGMVNRVQRLSRHAQVTLFFYYSGHGSRGSLHLGNHRVSVSKIKSLLHKSLARTVVAFFDACHSGAVVRRKGLKRLPKFKIHIDRKRVVRGRVYISSSGEFESSLESDDVQGSYFTHFLLSGLRGQADRNKDGKIDVDELYQYTYRRTVARTAMTRRGTQHPSFELGLRGAGQLILTWPKQSKSGLIFGAALEGTYLILSRHQKELMAEVHKRKGQQTFVALPPQSYLVRKRTQKGVYVAEVNLLWGGKKQFRPTAFRLMAFQASANKGGAFVGPFHQLTLLADFRSGLVAGNPFVLGPHLRYQYYISAHLVFGVGAGYSFGMLAALAQEIPTHHAWLDGLLTYAIGWKTVTFEIGGVLSGSVAWQRVSAADTRLSPLFRTGAMAGLRWLFAQPFGLQLGVQGGLELANVGGEIRPRPYGQLSLGLALCW